jgi:hypothetical protein
MGMESLLSNKLVKNLGKFIKKNPTATLGTAGAVVGATTGAMGGSDNALSNAGLGAATGAVLSRSKGITSSLTKLFKK